MQLKTTKNYLVDCRCDEGFQQVLTDATELETQILPNFETEQLETGERNGSLNMRPEKRHHKIQSRNSKQVFTMLF